MPIYEYRCPNGHTFEIFQRFADAPIEVCQECGAGPVEKVLFPVAVHFKGSGFYATDYGRGGQKPTPDGDRGSSSSDSGSGEKAEKAARGERGSGDSGSGDSGSGGSGSSDKGSGDKGSGDKGSGDKGSGGKGKGDKGSDGKTSGSD